MVSLHIWFYYMSMSSFNKFSLRINSKISLTAFCTIWLHFYWRGFVLTKHQVQRFTRSKVLKKVLFILFCFSVCVFYKCWKGASPEIYQELLETTLKFTFHFFRWEFSHKNQVDGPHNSHWHIFLKRMIILNHIFVHRIRVDFGF